MAFPPPALQNRLLRTSTSNPAVFLAVRRPSSHAASANTPWDSASSHTRCASWRSTPLRLSSMTAPLYPISRDAQYRTADWAYASSSMRRTRISLTITSSTTSEAYPLPMSRSRIALTDAAPHQAAEGPPPCMHPNHSDRQESATRRLRHALSVVRVAHASACHCRQWTEFGRNRIRFDRPAADHRRKGQGPQPRMIPAGGPAVQEIAQR